MADACPRQPGWCDVCSRRVRWAEVQTCRHGATVATARDCRECRFAGPVIVDASGDPVGSKGCGCSALSRASGSTWLTCLATDTPVRAVKAIRCSRYETLAPVRSGR